ncbi:MAG TPA: Ca2+-dependent phosphoinositide-specific phospholipase C [Polyangiaceae bacterium]|nr:Ca2+-dependent phosphoinositide-specific phospholipase C [Polyangiaceae bacterium]
MIESEAAEPGTIDEPFEGWSTVEAARGKIMLALDNENAVRDAYVAGPPPLAGQIMFTNPRPGGPEAAFAVTKRGVGRAVLAEIRVQEAGVCRAPPLP